MMTIKIGLGGGCHWCTEAVYKSLTGVITVAQGYIMAAEPANSFSEAIVLEFDPKIISLEILIEIHLRTHKSASNHSFRNVYRSAVYVFNKKQIPEITAIIESLQSKFDKKLITKGLLFKDFKESREEKTNYYFKNPDKPFCEKYIDPKLKVLLQKFSMHVSAEAKAVLMTKTTKQ